jgi:hypothetical protein
MKALLSYWRNTEVLPETVLEDCFSLNWGSLRRFPGVTVDALGELSIITLRFTSPGNINRKMLSLHPLTKGSCS